MMAVSRPTARQPRKWSIAEDQKLREEVEAQRSTGEVKDWCRIATKLPGRTNKDCRKRWHNSVAGGLKKGQWSKGEDAHLSRGVERFGQRWTLVAEVVGSRSADQCAKRWQQSLDPDLDRSEWREIEDQTLIEAVHKLGRHWKDIQRQHFPGRSKNCIKNRYTVLLRRYQNQGIALPEGATIMEPLSSPNRLSVYSVTDDDSLSYSSSSYGDLLAAPTQVSTPEAQNSWSINEEPYTSWPAQDSFLITSPAATSEFIPISQQTSAQPWNWNTTCIAPPPILASEPINSYPNSFPAPAIQLYDSYGAMQHMAGPTSVPRSGNSPGPLYPAIVDGESRSSPRSPGPLPYQDPEAISRYMRYGTHNGTSYHY
ncbi:hypothetical protein K491DRAFT_290395 [Lophiostoma macrostomum CBS 122681]|uniref:Uncharacterized protein n=1 Tax=Lophiostoma macrostomum CBS 122681 TaxID=1314788 RepID=A0A6A6TFX6_9PLEO|nr:hypothetical protein K491DRAFT_290395 [Lophiostoma macrostomum CBS 122681]